MLIRLSLPSAKNAISRPSNDQKAPRASSVPGTRRISRLSSERIAIEGRPAASWIQRRTLRASGESTGAPRKPWPAGGMIVKRSDSSRDRRRTAEQKRQRRGDDRDGRDRPRERLAPAAAARSETTGAIAAPVADPSAIHFSSRPTSRADCQRSSGSFARQVFTIRSSAGGDSGATDETDGGSADMIAVISDAWLEAENAFRPVAIS